MSGSTDHIIRIYQMTPGPPERIAELDVHNVSRLVLILNHLCFAPSTSVYNEELPLVTVHNAFWVQLMYEHP